MYDKTSLSFPVGIGESGDGNGDNDNDTSWQATMSIETENVKTTSMGNESTEILGYYNEGI